MSRDCVEFCDLLNGSSVTKLGEKAERREGGEKVAQQGAGNLESFCSDYLELFGYCLRPVLWPVTLYVKR